MRDRWTEAYRQARSRPAAYKGPWAKSIAALRGAQDWLATWCFPRKHAVLFAAEHKLRRSRQILRTLNARRLP